jgi:hypothetical protein
MPWKVVCIVQRKDNPFGVFAHETIIDDDSLTEQEVMSAVKNHINSQKVSLPFIEEPFFVEILKARVKKIKNAS